MRGYNDDLDYPTEPFEYDWICIIEGDGLYRITYYTDEDFREYGIGDVLTFHYLINKYISELEWVQESLSAFIPQNGSDISWTIDNVTAINTSGEKLLLDAIDPEDARIHITEFLERATTLGDFEEILDEIMSDNPIL